MKRIALLCLVLWLAVGAARGEKLVPSPNVSGGGARGAVGSVRLNGAVDGLAVTGVATTSSRIFRIGFYYAIAGEITRNRANPAWLEYARLIEAPPTWLAASQGRMRDVDIKGI